MIVNLFNIMLRNNYKIDIVILCMLPCVKIDVSELKQAMFLTTRMLTGSKFRTEAKPRLLTLLMQFVLSKPSLA